MAVKIVLGKRPKHIAHTVRVLLPEGDVGEIRVKYAYRTRKEFAEFVDSLADAAEVKKPKSVDEDDVRATFADILEKTADSTADYILKILTEWELPDPLDRDSVLQLLDEVPGAALTIMSDYRAACVEGRLGN